LNDALDTTATKAPSKPSKPWLPFLALIGWESAILGPFLDDFHGRTGVLIYRDPVSIDVGSLHILGSAAWVRFVLGWVGRLDWKGWKIKNVAAYGERIADNERGLCLSS